MKSLFTIVLSFFALTSFAAEPAKKDEKKAEAKPAATAKVAPAPAKPAVAPVNSAPAPVAPAAPVAQPSRFGGMGGILGGIAAGIGLSYLFSHMGLDGLGEGIASMVSGLLMFGILALVGFWLYKKFSPKDKDNTDVLPAVKSPTVT